MSTRLTVNALAQTVAALAEGQKAQGEQLALILARLGAPSTPAPVVEAVETVVEPKVRLLCKSTRVAFIEACAYEVDGFSTWDLVCWALEDEARIPAGFGIGAKYRELYAEAIA
jgi:hypothetical protein